MLGYVIEYTAEGFALIVKTIGITDEIEEHLLLLQHDLLNAQLLTEHTERHHINQFLSNIRDGAETVYQPFAIGLQIIIEVIAISEVVEFAVE